jgi:hypothetical protein
MPPFPPKIRIAAAMWTPSYNVLGMVCICGNRFAHRADRWTVRCPVCYTKGNLGAIREHYVNEGFANVE